MKNMPKIISGMVGGGGATGTPTLKMSMREYQDMSIKVGDKVTVEIKKSDTSGI
jgi:predicted lysophospholipase L1 biosynthesis ABC-type transport system permease subunit